MSQNNSDDLKPMNDGDSSAQSNLRSVQKNSASELEDLIIKRLADRLLNLAKLIMDEIIDVINTSKTSQNYSNSDDLKPMNDGDSSAQSNLRSVQENSAYELEDVIAMLSANRKLIFDEINLSGFTNSTSNSDVINTSKTSQNHSNSDDLKPMNDGDSSAQSNLQSVQKNSASELEDLIIKSLADHCLNLVISIMDEISDVINTLETSQNHSNSDDLKPMNDGDSSAQSNLQSVQKNNASELKDFIIERLADRLSDQVKLIFDKINLFGLITISNIVRSNSDIFLNTSKTSQNHSSEKSDNLETVSQNIKQENIPTTSSNLGETKPRLETVRNAMAWEAYTSKKQRRLRKLPDVRNEHVSKLPGIDVAYSKILVENKYEKIGSVLDMLLELEMNSVKFNKWMKGIGIDHDLWINQCYTSLLEWGTKENKLEKEK